MIQSEETDHSKARPETIGHHHHRHNNNNNNASKSILPTTKASSSASTSTASCWSSRFKDPRVVRVSKALGGKDRHSKVCTVRGLRDRRVRLSVPTAIQLYDLQERLGLNQPSKAVDWLLNVAKNEIDELPPLQIPPGMMNFGDNYNNNNNNLQPILDFQDSRSDKQGLKIDSSDFYRGKSNDRDENSWARNHQEERQLQFQFHPLENNSNNNNNNNQALLLNSTYNSIFRLDPSNLSLSQHNPRMLTGQHEDWHNFGLLPFQPALSTTHHHVPPGSSHQVIVYHQPEMSTTQSYFPSSGQFDPKQANFHQSSPMLTDDSTSQPVICRPIHFNMTANLLPSQDNNDDKYR